MPDDAPTQGPPQAYPDIGMAYQDGSGVPAGLPESAFPHPKWSDSIDRRLKEPGDTGMEINPNSRQGVDTGWKNQTRWLTPIKDRYT